MAAPSPLSDLTSLSAAELRALVTDLVTQLQAVRDENAALRDEIARLNGLQGRPRLKPSGMEPATGHGAVDNPGGVWDAGGQAPAARRSDQPAGDQRGAGPHRDAATGRAVQGL